MRVTRVYADANGISHFDEVELPMAMRDFSPPAPPVEISADMPATRILWYRGPARWFGDWHPAPHRQLLVQLTGSLEIRTGDGEMRVFAPGNVCLLEDVAGQGHVTTLHGGAGDGSLATDEEELEGPNDPWSVTGLFVQLPEA